jgi:hypothetical protein
MGAMNNDYRNSPPADHATADDPPEDRWPPRSRRLLGELRALCSDWLHKPLLRTLDHFDTCLHQQAGRSLSHLDQANFQATRQLLMQERQTFDQRFIASIDQAFDQLGQPSTEPAARASQTLSLLDTTEHELTTSLDQLVARSEARGGAQLLELGYRLAALIAAAPLDGAAVPIGPQAMAKAFSDASRTLKLPSEHELLLLQSLESSLIQELTSLHELANAHLQGDGILPDLRPFALPRATPRRPRSTEQPASPMTVQPLSEQPPAEVSEMPDQPLKRSTWASTLPRAHIAARGTVSNAELQVASSALQDYLVKADEQARRALQDPQRLREELLIQLNVGRSGDASHTTLSTEQDDALEMIARLFAQMAQQLPPSREAQTLLGNLQLPMLREALDDPRFFEQHEHPARKMLGRVAEIARDWLDDANGEIDRALRTKLDVLIERAGRESSRAHQYIGLLDDIEQYLTQLQHRTEVAERRQIEAMQGLERLEQARHRTVELLTLRFAPSSAHRRRLDQLDRAWADVLALTLLRHGDQSEIFGTMMVVTDQLLGALPVGNRDKLQHEVDAGLRQIGLHGDEATRVAQRLINARHAEPGRVADAADAADSASPGRGDSPGRQRQTDGEFTDDTLAKPSAEVLSIHRHLRTLPVGGWFEFVDPSGERGKRRRLIWYSSLTGHSLFVTRSGQRAEEFDQLQLAQEISRGHIREVVVTQDEDVLNHAWHIVAEQLASPRRPLAPGAR